MRPVSPDFAAAACARFEPPRPPGLGHRVAVAMSRAHRQGPTGAARPSRKGAALGPRLRRAFFDRSAEQVAAELVGARIVHRLADGSRLVGRIVEVEAYRGDGSDPASHAHCGPTTRNAVMFGPPGRLYAYRSYGIHTCVNVVCRPRGVAEAVLLRALEPIVGVERMCALRGLSGPARPAAVASGPGRLAQALGLTLEDDGRTLLGALLAFHAPPDGEPAVRVQRGRRVGITKASDLALRFWDPASACVSPFRPGKRRSPRG